MEVAEQRMSRTRKKLSDRTKALEAQAQAVEASKEALRAEISGLGREIDALRRQHEADLKQIEDMQHDREMLNKKVEKAAGESAKQVTMVRTGEVAKQNLQQEIEAFKQENQRQRKEIYALERERERSVAEAQAATSTYLQAMEEVKLRESAIADLQKKIAEQEAKLKQQKALYEAIRGERNLYSKNLIEAQEEIAEMQRKFKILNHQIEQLREEIAAKSMAQVSEHFLLVRVQKLRDKYKTELDQVSRQVEVAEGTVTKQQDEIKHLASIIAALEADVARQRKENEIVANEKDILMQQLVRRNEEIALLYEKIGLQQHALTTGEQQYREKAEDVRLLRTKIADTRREIANMRGAAQQSDTLKTETYQLQRELLAERARVRALSDELENPMNIHRWRKLQGSDPAAYELIQNIQAL
jgi:chromosome segregation ATPase